MQDHDNDPGEPIPEPGPGQPANTSGADPSPVAGAFADGMAQAARRAGLGQVADGEPITHHALLAAMGGIRGIVEAVLPGLVFLLTYTFSQDLVPALIAPVVIGIGFAAARLAQKQTVTQAIGGLVGIGVSAVLVLLSGKAENFYLPGFWTNAAYAAALLVSVFVRWPLVGLAVGFLMGEGTAWRLDPVKRRMLTVLTVCWAGLFVLRLAVQLPLYYAGNVEWLGATRLLMGIPLYAPLLVVSWLLVRAVYRKAEPSDLG
ncbi:DUF3159 domain-containing protein [Glaciibacter sp. 2TAF33]|uniref:DUF3159 domain-containing protein n=1 Tax=Glaciibacter sp. 2TAF33 TaxID=3233015 RepID=UPI003F93AFAA